MPELPDVAGFKSYLDATALHLRIETTRCYDERFIQGVSRQGLQRKLKGATLEQSCQWGKWLLVELSEGGWLVLHFGMTGWLDYGRDEGDPPDHTRLQLTFDNGYRLAIVSPRMLGQASYCDDPEAFVESHDLGPSALDVGRGELIDRIQGRSGAIKSTLMNQSIVAGIGNVYSDEILFQAGIHPKAKADRLDDKHLADLHRVMRRVLRVASRKSAEGGKMPSGWLLPVRGEGPCPRCDGKQSRLTVSGRTAWYCPSCQKKP